MDFSRCLSRGIYPVVVLDYPVLSIRALFFFAEFSFLLQTSQDVWLPSHIPTRSRRMSPSTALSYRLCTAETSLLIPGHGSGLQRQAPETSGDFFFGVTWADWPKVSLFYIETVKQNKKIENFTLERRKPLWFHRYCKGQMYEKHRSILSLEN